MSFINLIIVLISICLLPNCLTSQSNSFSSFNLEVGTHFIDGVGIQAEAIINMKSNLSLGVKIEHTQKCFLCGNSGPNNTTESWNFNKIIPSIYYNLRVKQLNILFGGQLIIASPSYPVRFSNERLDSPFYQFGFVGGLSFKKFITKFQLRNTPYESGNWKPTVSLGYLF
jgi:hypothetical protein